MRNNVLDPAASGNFIACNSTHVKIKDEGVNYLCDEVNSAQMQQSQQTFATKWINSLMRSTATARIAGGASHMQSICLSIHHISKSFFTKLLLSLKTGKLQIPDPGGGDIPSLQHNPRATDWIFVTDALNFCFWSNERQGWTVDGQTGYFALQSALCRAIKEGKDFTNTEYYSKITKEELKHVLRSDTKAEIALFKERLSILHEIGDILIQKYNGTFDACITESKHNAGLLLRIVVENFPSFRDEAEFHGRKVSFYKRGQVLVSHLAKFFEEKSQGMIDGVDKLTMFADYRVPQVLCHFGVLSYSNELMEALRSNTILPSGSPEEVKIRGCSIHAVELIQKCLKNKILKNKLDNIEPPNSMLLDYHLWCYRRKYAKKLLKVPFHKTLGIYY